MNKQKLAYTYGIVTVLLWATVASAFKISLTYLDPLNLLLYSSAFSTLILFFIVQFQRKWKLLKSYSKNDYKNSALLGFLNPFLYYAVLFEAYSLLPAQEAQPLNQIWAIVLSLLSILLLKQKIRFSNIFAIFVSFFGVLIVSTQGNIFALNFSNPIGAALALGSTIIWSLFWIYNVKDERDDVTKLFLNFAFGLIYLFIFMLALSKIVVPNTFGLLGAAYIGFFEMGITFVAWLKALRLSETTAQVSNLIYLVPFLSLIVIYFTIGETILPSTIIGLILIVSGVLLQKRAASHQRKKSNLTSQ
ncbi:MAG: DMT family transporter [Candidatus Bathyarchaeota archaeon]|nr:MAG: DMT family transporter [Candidatus Bathyarchaeota archaeon]